MLRKTKIRTPGILAVAFLAGMLYRVVVPITQYDLDRAKDPPDATNYIIWAVFLICALAMGLMRRNGLLVVVAAVIGGNISFFIQSRHLAAQPIRDAVEVGEVFNSAILLVLGGVGFVFRQSPVKRSG